MQITLLFEEAITEQLDKIRKTYYPKHLNKSEAHLTVIYKLDETLVEIIDAIKDYLVNTINFYVAITHVQCNAKGNQVNISSNELLALHEDITNLIGVHLFRKDKLPFVPHITIQHGVTAYKAQRSTQEIANYLPKPPYKAIGAVCKYFQTTPKGKTEIIYFK